MAYLVLYGSQNINNNKFMINQANNLRSTSRQLQTVVNARFAGSTVVDRKINEKVISLNGVIQGTDSLTLRDVIKEYSKAFNKEDRYFRVSENYHVFTPMVDATGWQTEGDSINMSFDNEVYQYGGGSVSFDADVSLGNDMASAITFSATDFNLAPYGNSGAFECWVYLPTKEGMEHIDLAIGNDMMNLMYGQAYKQYDGADLEAGWNYVSFRVADMVQYGTIDPYNFGEYIDVSVFYSGISDQTGFRMGGVLWQEEDRTINYRSYIGSFNASAEYYEIDQSKYSLEVFAYEGVSESTGEYNVLGLAGNTTATTTGSIELDGTYTPLPIVTIDVNSATNVSGITLTNTTTGDSTTVSRTYSAGDKLIIDTDNREVTVGGASQDYDDVLPRFELGENDIQVSIITTGAESVEQETQDINLTGEI